MMLRSSVLSLATISALLLGNSLHAQVQQCYTDEMRQRMIAENPDLLRQEAEYETNIQAYLRAKADQRDDADTTTLVLPLVFHILYDPTIGNDAHNVSDQVIFDQVAKLNLDYSASNPDLDQICCGFSSIIGNTRVKWELATKDPFGNCTNGIDRITSQRSSLAGNFSKLNPWFRDNYVNVWVIKEFPPIGGGGILAGFSQLPPDVQDASGSLRDGVIMRADALSDFGSDNTTLTHELGHFLNLQHTWGNTNDPNVACGDDQVDDTPMTKGHQFVCPLYDSFCSLQPTDTAYTFNDVTTTSGTTDPSPVPTIGFNDTLPGLTLSPFTAVGISPNSSIDSSFSFSQWGTGALQGDSLFGQLTGSINTGQYYEFTVTPEVGRSMTLSDIRFRVNRSATGPRTFAVRSNAGSSPFQANIVASVIPSSPYLGLGPSGSNTFFFKEDTTVMVNNSKVTLSGNEYHNVPSPITFRIYAWNAEDADGYFTVDSVAVNGNFGIIENVQNYMEYSGCAHMFTAGQSDRMRATLHSDVSSRNNLWSDANHQYTGINGYEQACGPQAGFYSMNTISANNTDGIFACPGIGIRFKDNSTRATPTSWAWSFEGGSPATSTEQNPVVSFDEPGIHSVTLTVGNEYGSSTVTKEKAVYIGANYSEVGEVLNEAFDTEERFSKWPIVNFENNMSRWLWSSDVGHNAVGCAKLNASDTYTLVQDIFNSPDAYFADKDELVTPILDLRYMNSITLNFWYAYAARTTELTDVTEKLEVYSSTNCGESWLSRGTISGGDLVTAGIQTPGYIPGESDWREASISLSSALATGHVRFKFVYTSGLNSNDLYIDDVNIAGTNVGIDELAQSGGLGLMPNPASNALTVSVNLAGSPSGTLSFLDMTGRTVYTQMVHAGAEQIELDLDKMGLTSGVYLVQLKHAKGQRVERLVVR